MTGVEVRLSRTDALAAARLHHLAYVCGRFCAAVIAVLAMSFAVFLYVALGANRGALEVGAAVALSVAALLYGLLLVRHAILPPYVVHRQFKEHKRIGEAHRITWSEHGYVVRGATMQSDIPWGDYWRWRENGRVLLLYVSSRQYQLVPKLRLPPGAVEEMRGYLDKAGVKRSSLFLS